MKKNRNGECVRLCYFLIKILDKESMQTLMSKLKMIP